MKKYPQNTIITQTLSHFEKEISELKTFNDAQNFIKDLIGPVIQKMLEAEMTHHLGYEKHSKLNENLNSRNGYSKKTLQSSFGKTVLDIPRDRAGEFNPLSVEKHSRTQSDIETKIIAMYAKGLTTTDINKMMFDIYGIEVSASMVSSITDSILPDLREWQARPLNKCYPFVYIDGIHFKIRTDQGIKSQCAYIMLGITTEGTKEIIGIWIGEAESAKFWMGIFDEVKKRGIESILILCSDGLSGILEALRAIYPDTNHQLCIIHQLRATLKYVPHRDKGAVAASLKRVYTALDKEKGFHALQGAIERFPQYARYIKVWEDKWESLSVFFDYPEEIRKIIYTTNTIESLNRQFRKITKTTSTFPHKESLLKLLFLGMIDIQKGWTKAVSNWGSIAGQLMVLYPESEIKFLAA